MPPDESPFLKYPAFQPMFERAESVPVPLYLELLNLSGGVEVALAQLQRVLGRGSDLTPQVASLLDDFNWRPQIVGAVAMGLGAADEESCAALWRAFEGGSWVSPQLAAIALLVDQNFEAKARVCAEAGCPINRDRLEGLGWIVRHSAAGPGSFRDHSGKALSALAALCERLPAARPWLEPLLAREDIQQSITGDHDGGGRIATGWLEGFVRLTGSLRGGEREAVGHE